MPLTTAQHSLLLRPRFSPARIPGLQLWLDASRSPLTMAAGMASQFTAANSEYLSIADNASLSMSGTQSFTIGAWVYMDSLPAVAFVLQKGDGVSNSTYEYALYYDNGTARFIAVIGTGSGSHTVSASTFGAPSTGTWYFVCVRHTQGVDIAISVNGGTLDTTGHTSGSQDTTNEFRIGRDGGAGGNYWNGRMQCVFIAKEALTTAQITAAYNGGTPLSYNDFLSKVTPSALQGYWELNEPSSTRKDLHGSNDLTDNNTVTTSAGTCLNAVGQINDLSGKGNHASQSTQASKPVIRFAQNGIGGKAALRFDGTDDVLSVTDAAGIEITNGLTVFAVVDIAATGADMRVLGKWHAAAGGREYLLDYLTGTSRFNFSVREAGDANTRTATANTYGAPSANTPVVI